MNSLTDNWPALPRSIWRSPLVPTALIGTFGIALDRLFSIDVSASLLTLAGALLLGFPCLICRRSRAVLVCLAIGCLACGSAYHHIHCHLYQADDIGEFAPKQPRPAQVKGILEEEPRRWIVPQFDPLRTREQIPTASGILLVTGLHHQGAWLPVSGRLRLMVPGVLAGLHAGDEVEVSGLLGRIEGPANPGGFDPAGHWRDQRVRGQLRVRQTDSALKVDRQGWTTSIPGWLGAIRTWGQDTLVEALPNRSTGGVAAALLLGDGAPMSQSDWDKYIHTGVIHVLAISGQHLVILASVLWFGLRFLGVRQRPGAIAVALVLFIYALITGGRPPALRAAVVAAAFCGGLIFRRPSLPANLFALAWLVVAFINPTDLYDTGCQLSFLSVAALYWGAQGLSSQRTEALDQLVESARPTWEKTLRSLGWNIAQSYLLTLLVWSIIVPLLAFHTHAIPPIGLLLGPPISLLATVALLAGFVLLLTAPVLPVLVPFLAPFVHVPLAGCEMLVDLAEGYPTHLTIPDIPLWWLVPFYLIVLAWLTQLPLRSRWPWGIIAALSWLCVGLIGGAAPQHRPELRCTFLAVGHGGCVVIQTPDGRTLLYDAGAITGPEVAHRHIVPFLLHQGVRRIDEVFLSHADLDHFNGLVGLLDCFAVGQVTRTPTFPNKDNAAIRYTLETLQKRHIPDRVARAGDRFRAGSVSLEVLHPPPEGPDGNENTRSLVLLIEHEGHRILLTGDLEGEGLERVLQLPPCAVGVLQAPHHGSHRVDGAALTRWCQPQLVVSCQGVPKGANRSAAPYTQNKAFFWATNEQGAVTVISQPGRLEAQTFRTGQRLSLRSREELASQADQDR